MFVWFDSILTIPSFSSALAAEQSLTNSAIVGWSHKSLSGNDEKSKDDGGADHGDKKTVGDKGSEQLVENDALLDASRHSSTAKICTSNLKLRVPFKPREMIANSYFLSVRLSTLIDSPSDWHAYRKILDLHYCTT